MTPGVAALGGARQDIATDRPAVDRPELVEVQRLFYSGEYHAAAELALSLRAAHADDLDSYEIRASALHFQLKRAIRGTAGQGGVPFKDCTACPELLKQFLSETAKGQTLARARLQNNPTDDTAQFFLGKFDLNYVWLHLGTLEARPAGVNTGRRADRSTRCSSAIRRMSARRARLMDYSSIPR
jgi:hypothetical protein